MGNTNAKKSKSETGKDMFVKTLSASSVDETTKKMKDLTVTTSSASTKKSYKLKMARPVKKAPTTQKERTISNEREGNQDVAAPASQYPSRKWTAEQDAQLRIAVEHFNGKNWKAISEAVPGRTHVQCLQRWKKVLQPGLVKGHWTEEEDAQLIKLVTAPNQTLTSWVAIAQHIPGRTAKQCRERWSLNLDPSIKKGPWEAEEDKKLLELHKQLGNRWAEISQHMGGRTENAVKTRYKSLLRKQQKVWSEEEDQAIIDAKKYCNHRWVSIANRLPGRSKNAVRLRWKHLVSENPALESPVPKEDKAALQKAAEDRLRAFEESLKVKEESKRLMEEAKRRPRYEEVQQQQEVQHHFHESPAVKLEAAFTQNATSITATDHVVPDPATSHMGWNFDTTNYGQEVTPFQTYQNQLQVQQQQQQEQQQQQQFHYTYQHGDEYAVGQEKFGLGQDKRNPSIDSALDLLAVTQSQQTPPPVQQQYDYGAYETSSPPDISTLSQLAASGYAQFEVDSTGRPSNLNQQRFEAHLEPKNSGYERLKPKASLTDHVSRPLSANALLFSNNKPLNTYNSQDMLMDLAFNQHSSFQNILGANDDLKVV